MPISTLILMLAIVIAAGGFTIWLGYAAGLMVAGPVLIGLMALRLWMVRK